MNIQPPKIGATRPVIRQLDDSAANRIAAGEVVERPASAVKEIVENALDAGATRIEIAYADGGKTLIRVSDDGCGMTAEDLPLALSRHATSKIDGSDLLNIHTFGFRGEALPSLGAVGRLSIASRAEGFEAAQMSVEGGRPGPVKPAALNRGTVVELRDLFYATPARLKFMRTDRAEAQAILDAVKRLAMAEPYVSFRLNDISNGATRELFRADAEQGELFGALAGRLARILGRDFTDNAMVIDAEREGIRLTGYAALPTYSRGAAVEQFLFVNGRPVRDKMLLGALRAGYMDVLPRDRHPAAALFLSCDPERVDVNVHPAKAEVRFREAGIPRGLIVTAIRHALAEAGQRASSTVGTETLAAFRPEPVERQMTLGEPAPQTAFPPRVYQMDRPSAGAMRASYAAQAPLHDFEEAPPPPWAMPAAQPLIQPSAPAQAPAPPARQVEHAPLGAPRPAGHENYIIAQTETGMVIVDQHAAHERLNYERLKRQMAEKGVAAQALLIPEIVELSPGDAALLLDHADDLARLGLGIEPFGGSAVAVRETPAILGEINAANLLRDVLDELSDLGGSDLVLAKIDAVLSRMACHGSIRSGRRMQVEEMNALLREMEATPFSGQCNHGRPTYVELKLSDIERLFGRT
ncbi:DNA mismatch repair endonuclease MutL [Paenirhodobacter enshiensis]|uniref:DNA mismatch repair endonuclease MutL n=1 Tax=Paenirhodobacter enshiensis TaxID=1105367 RepID=UPI003FA1BDA6